MLTSSTYIFVTHWYTLATDRFVFYDTFSKAELKKFGLWLLKCDNNIVPVLLHIT